MIEHFVPWLVYIGLGLACLQFSVGIGFTIRLLAARIRPAPDADCGRAAIILCLRGADPFLERSLSGILTQDYPNFEVVIVVDHRDDPAWQPVHEMVARLSGRTTARSVRIEELRDRPETCSLKNASLIQAYESLGPEVEFTATIDADVEPHRTWLRELVAPLSDRRIGATTGNRWYMPEDSGWGSLVRYQWNAGAVVPMFWHGIAWGGSVALRASFVRDSGYRERMRHALCEDTMLYDTLRKVGLKLRFVPSLLMVNRESIGMLSFFRFCRRQMLISNYHSQAWAIWLHGLTSSAFYVVAATTIVVALARGDYAAARTVGSIFVVFLASMALVLPALETAVRRIVRLRGESPPKIPPVKLLKIVFTLLVVTQIVYGAVVWSLVRVRRIEWRGIYYRLRGIWNVHRENYAAYRPASDEALAQRTSL
ncbi:MAG: glycosyltransferase family 2 protein [Planctomycetia bacterium]|nr:glycosyltransferase family 2 protein [Planctomycetia bacterium]